MNKHIKQGTPERRHRRSFVKGAAGLTFAFALGGAMLGRASEAFAADRRQAQRLGDDRRRQHHHHPLPDRRDGAGRADALPLILAEELDADWSKVKMRVRAGQSEGLRQRARDVPRRADHAASVSVPGYFMPLRMAGAQARRCCSTTSRREWKVPVERTDDRQEHGHPREVEAPHLLRRRRQVRQGAGRAAEDHRSRSEEAGAVQADRPQGHRPRRRAVQGQRHGQVRHRRAGAGHGLRLGAASADGRRQGRERQHRRRQEDQGRHQGAAAAVRRRGASATPSRRRAPAATRSRSSGTRPARPRPFDSEKAKEEYARKGKDPNAEAMEEYKVGDADKALGRRRQDAGGGLLVGALLPRPDGADERRRQGLRRTASRPKSGSARRCSRSPPPSSPACSRPRRTRSRSTSNCSAAASAGASGRTPPIQATILVQHRQEAGEAHPHPRGRRRRGAAAADDASRAQGRPRRQGQPGRLASPPRGGERRCGRRAAALRGDRRQGLSSAARGLDQEFYAIPNAQAEDVREIRGMRVHAWRGIGAGYNKFAAESFLDEVAQRARARIRSRCGSS